MSLINYEYICTKPSPPAWAGQRVAFRVAIARKTGRSSGNASGESRNVSDNAGQQYRGPFYVKENRPMADHEKEKHVGVVRGTITIEVECRVLEGATGEDMLTELGGDIEHWLHDH